MGRIPRVLRYIITCIGTILTVSLFLKYTTLQDWLPDQYGNDQRYTHPDAFTDADFTNLTQSVTYYVDHPIRPPYKYKFWEAGQRSRQIGRWLSIADRLEPGSRLRKEFLRAAEATAQPLFPFLQARDTQFPLWNLRQTYKKGSRGIVIPVGGDAQAVRFAGHLILSLRQVLDCRLPIHIAYAGEEDLSQASREIISALPGATAYGLEFVDVLKTFNDSCLKLERGEWAIKIFAVLASSFEEVILVDADAVFLQKPEELFRQQGYINKGAYLFHDRLLWQYAYQERHDWWEDQIKRPSREMLKSLVWMDSYAEECDSGVVVVDKSRVEVFVGLLHVAWQNTYDVREEVTYRLTHGDKESWWLGLEISGSAYEFESHYGTMIGWADGSAAFSVEKVCSFAIAHLDQEGRLIWYNGSLLKNKRVSPDEYDVPEYWMIDGRWEKGLTREDMSCMTGSQATKLTVEQKQILSENINLAKKVDVLVKTHKSTVLTERT